VSKRLFKTAREKERLKRNVEWMAKSYGFRKSTAALLHGKTRHAVDKRAR
jgi:hypothetical protein